jgi:hypothetical protein
MFWSARGGLFLERRVDVIGGVPYPKFDSHNGVVARKPPALPAQMEGGPILNEGRAGAISSFSL